MKTTLQRDIRTFIAALFLFSGIAACGDDAESPETSTQQADSEARSRSQDATVTGRTDTPEGNLDVQLLEDSQDQTDTEEANNDALPADTGAEAGDSQQPAAEVASTDTEPSMEDVDIEDVVPTLTDTVDPGDSNIVDDVPSPPMDTGLEPLPDTQPPGPPPEWLLSIDNGTGVLQRVNITTGATTDLCDLYDPTLAPIANYPSLTFSRNNFLYASRGGSALDLIDPCTCEVTQLGDFGIWTGVNGITSDKGIQLLGAATTQDELFSIQTKTGVGTLIGDMGVNFTTSGATWSDTLNGLYAINGSNNGLYTIDPITGAATFLVTLSMNFGTVGIELLPANGVIYACSSEANLLSIDPSTGVVTNIGPMNQSGACSNLAAPWKSVPCVEP